jgi:threonine dehydratase
MMLVDDRSLTAMTRLAARTLGKLLEPTAAAGLAAIGEHDLPGERLATVRTGSNVSIELVGTVLAGAEPALTHPARPLVTGLRRMGGRVPERAEHQAPS